MNFFAKGNIPDEENPWYAYLRDNAPHHPAVASPLDEAAETQLEEQGVLCEHMIKKLTLISYRLLSRRDFLDLCRATGILDTIEASGNTR